MAKPAFKVAHKILEATTDEEIKACYPVIVELRPHVPNENELLRQVKIQREQEGFHLMYIKDTIEGESEPRPVSIMSYRIYHCLFYGRQLYVNDVCTISSAKKRGYAGALLGKLFWLTNLNNLILPVHSCKKSSNVAIQEVLLLNV